MKLGFLGNANNYPFMIARALKRLGQDVLFLVDRTSSGWERLNRPENRYPDIAIPYPDWIRDLSPLYLWTFRGGRRRRRDALDLLRTCDAVFLNEYGPSIGPEIGRPTYLLLTGTDVEFLADHRYAETQLEPTADAPWPLRPFRWLKNAVKKRLLLRRIEAQREGIRRATAFNYFARGIVPNGDRILDEIGADDSRRTAFMITDVESIAPAPYPENAVPRLFCVARLSWQTEPSFGIRSVLDFKGSDVLIRALGRFYRRTRKPMDIHLVRKGTHVRQAEALVREEGLDELVTWHEEMSQQEVLEEYRKADIVFEQLSSGMIGLGTFDAMATGRPVIANGRPEFFEKAVGAPSPLCQAASIEEVEAQLERLVPDRELRRDIGRASRAYVERYVSTDRAARICLERLA